MAKYRVYLVAVVETTVEVEADNKDEAIEAAFESDLPYLNISNGDMDMGDWELCDWELSEDLWPGQDHSAYDSVKEID